jgi:selenocysteine-specific translation elongation factor
LLAATAHRDGDRDREARGRPESSTCAGTAPVVTGTLVEGSIAVADALRVVGPSRELASSARGLQVHGASVDAASAPCRLAVALAGVETTDVSRGDVVTTGRRAGDDVAHRRGRARLQSFAVTGDSRRGATFTFHTGTSRAAARIERDRWRSRVRPAPRCCRS